MKKKLERIILTSKGEKTVFNKIDQNGVKTMIRKRILPMLAGLVFAATTAFTATNTTQNQGFSLEEGQLNPAYSAPARIDVQGAWDAYISADFLYWQTMIDDTAYAISSTKTSGSYPPQDGHFIYPKFKWRPGVKVGLGFNFDRDDWNLFFEWTHMLGRGSGSTARPDTGVLIPQSAFLDEALPVISKTCSDASMNGRQNYNTVDMNIGRPYYSGKHLVFKPFIGVRGAWIRNNVTEQYNHLNLTYSYVSNDVLTVATLTDGDWSKIKAKQRMWGLGPRVGLDSDWLLGCGCRFFNKTSGSLLFERTKNSFEHTVSDDIISDISRYYDDLDNPILSIKASKLNLFRPNINTVLGLGWGTYFDHHNWHFDISAAYELNYWFDHLLPKNMYQHGLTVELRLDF